MNSIALLTSTIDASGVLSNSWSDWLAGQMSSFTPLNVAAVLLSGLVIGILISLVYKKTYHGVLYSPNFSLTLIMLTLVTAPVTMCIGSNVALSMGMVGALSIVRFRTAVKDPLDTCYMFWSITMGILLGAGQFVIALVVAVGIALIMLLLSYVRFRNPNSYLLVLHYDREAESAIMDELKNMVRFYRLRSKTESRNGAEMTVEVRMDRRGDLVGGMLDIEGVHDATLVACQTEAGA